MENHQAIESPNRPSSQFLAVKIAVAITPVLLYGFVIARLGFNGLNERIDQYDPNNIGYSILVHAAPLIWLMFSPVFLVPGALKRPNTPIRDYFTPDLAMCYSPQDVSMAAGAHNSRKFDVRDIDENVVATGVGATLPLPSVMKLKVGDESYEAVYNRVYDKKPTSLLEPVHPGTELRVSRYIENAKNDETVLMQYVQTAFHSDPHLITFDGAPDLWLKPNPATSFPNRYDMVVEDQVVGKVVKPGKFLFRGVLVITSHYPPNVRAMIAGLCYQMMRG